MSVKLSIGNKDVPVRFIEFSDGSSSVQVEWEEGYEYRGKVVISVNPETPCDLYLHQISSTLQVCWDYLVKDRSSLSYNDWNWPLLCLYLPYLPYGRADRAFNKGNAAQVDLFINHIRDFDEVIIADPHNEVVVRNDPYLGEKLTIIPQHKCFMETVHHVPNGVVIVSPDKGATEKANELLLKLLHNDVLVTLLQASKIRDKGTGRITATEIPDDVDIKGKTCIIVDDICDGGGTFLPLAYKLKAAGAARVELYVTHGIFAKGLALFKGQIDHIYAWHTVGTYINQSDILNYNSQKETK